MTSSAQDGGRRTFSYIGNKWKRVVHLYKQSIVNTMKQTLSFETTKGAGGVSKDLPHRSFENFPGMDGWTADVKVVFLNINVVDSSKV